MRTLMQYNASFYLANIYKIFKKYVKYYFKISFKTLECYSFKLIMEAKLSHSVILSTPNTWADRRKDSFEELRNQMCLRKYLFWELGMLVILQNCDMKWRKISHAMSWNVLFIVILITGVTYNPKTPEAIIIIEALRKF